MPYTPPELNTLLSQQHRIEAFCQSSNSERQDIANLLIAVSNKINQDAQMDQAEKQEALIGAYIYASETIKQSYYLHSPEFKQGCIYNSGSKLYSEINNILKVDKNDNPLSAREGLIYLNRFYHFISTTRLSDNDDINTNTIINNSIKFLKSFLVKLATPINKAANALPSEQTMSQQMESLANDYIKEKNEKKQKPKAEYVFLAQLGEAIADIDKQDDANQHSGQLSHSQKIKIGALLYIQMIINNSYIIRSSANSTLHQQCTKIMNNRAKSNLDNVQQQVCLAAFKNHIDNYDNRRQIEQFGHLRFDDKNLLVNLDIPLKKISKEIDKLDEQLQSSFSQEWPMTSAGFKCGAMAGAPIFYGVGEFCGGAAALGNQTRSTSNSIGKGLHTAAVSFWGNSYSTGYYCYKIGDDILYFALARAFGKAFEYVGGSTGGIAVAMIGLGLDVSYKGFKRLCNDCLNYYDEHPDEQNQVDYPLAKCLLNLPPEVLGEETKQQIRYSTDLDNNNNSERSLVSALKR